MAARYERERGKVRIRMTGFDIRGERAMIGDVEGKVSIRVGRGEDKNGWLFDIRRDKNNYER